jgi:spore coat protein E
MSNIREIYTKAIVAKGKKLSRNTYSFDLKEKADVVLGCYITNHHFEAVVKQGIPKIIGTYDIHIWYSIHNDLDTMIEKKQVSYIDEMQVIKKENREFEADDVLKARCMLKPKCLNAYIRDEQIVCEVEKEMQIEISGETCIRVEVKNEEEVWDDIEDIEVNPDFIK